MTISSTVSNGVSPRDTNTEIAEQLYLSVRTVETHRAHVQQKLGISTRAELVGYAIERGLISTGAKLIT